MLSPFKSFAKIIIYLFALIGFVFVAGYFLVKFGVTNTRGVVDEQQENFIRKPESDKTTQKAVQRTWNESEEWETLKEAIIKDENAIKKAAKDAGVSARLITTQLVVEQLRLYHSDRELFKTIFSPLKILGNQSQFSWGVMGIKQETAKEIEAHLKDHSSPYYPGLLYEHLLDFKTEDPDTERFERIVKEDDRYYSYLYAGLYIKEILAQWKKAGFPIANRSEIISTLYNIGFEHSVPKADPQSGGAFIEIKGAEYSFGSLAKDFYDSGEMIEEFGK